MCIAELLKADAHCKLNVSEFPHPMQILQKKIDIHFPGRLQMRSALPAHCEGNASQLN
jgi:hypothetical protein